MILTEYTRAGCGATVDELLVVAGENPVGGEVGAIKTDIYLYQIVHRADKGRVNKTRQRIVGAICRAAFSFGMEDLESRFDELLPKSPILVREVRRIYDKTYYSTGVCQTGTERASGADLHSWCLRIPTPHTIILPCLCQHLSASRPTGGRQEGAT